MGPILLICKTNHALDQFLEHIIGFTTNVVRLGGRTKSEIVGKYNLFHRTKGYKNPLRRSVNSAFRDKMEIIDNLQKLKYKKYFPFFDLQFIKINYWSKEGFSWNYMEKQMDEAYKQSNSTDEIFECQFVMKLIDIQKSYLDQK